MLVRGLEEEQGSRVPLSLRRTLLPPESPIVERLAGHAFVEIPQRHVDGAGAVGFLQALGGEGGISIGHEEGLTDGVERGLDRRPSRTRVAPGSTAGPLLDVALAPPGRCAQLRNAASGSDGAGSGGRGSEQRGARGLGQQTLASRG